MSFGFTPKQAAAYDQWKTTPPDDDRWGDECPNCGAEIEQHDYGFRCKKECGWYTYPEDIDVPILGEED